MTSRRLLFADPYRGLPPDYFLPHSAPASLVHRLTSWLYTERPDLPTLVEMVDIPEVFLDIPGSVYHAERTVRVRLPRGYTVACHLCHAHAVVSQLREKGYLRVQFGRGLPFVVIPGFYSGAVLYEDDADRVADAFAEHAAEGAALYEGTRAAIIAQSHGAVVDARPRSGPAGLGLVPVPVDS